VIFYPADSQRSSAAARPESAAARRGENELRSSLVCARVLFPRGDSHFRGSAALDVFAASSGGMRDGRDFRSLRR